MIEARIRARFDAKWTPEPNTGCWLWFGTRKWGYGRFRVGGRDNGRVHASHRLAWEWANERSAEGFVVRHKCDNPSCVNPDHLEIGTLADNARDCVERGRHGLRLHPESRAIGDRNGSRLHPGRRPRGERHACAKLTEAEVREIRQILSTGEESQRSVARRYKVSGFTIGSIRHGRGWRHIL